LLKIEREVGNAMEEGGGRRHRQKMLCISWEGKEMMNLILVVVEFVAPGLDS